jgi:hypothetical protein
VHEESRFFLMREIGVRKSLIGERIDGRKIEEVTVVLVLGVPMEGDDVSINGTQHNGGAFESAATRSECLIIDGARNPLVHLARRGFARVDESVQKTERT